MADIYDLHKLDEDAYTKTLNVSKLEKEIDLLHKQIEGLQNQINYQTLSNIGYNVRICPKCGSKMSLLEIITTIPPVNVFSCRQCGYREEENE